jgi:hypothetical protein
VEVTAFRCHLGVRICKPTSTFGFCVQDHESIICVLYKHLNLR